MKAPPNAAFFIAGQAGVVPVAMGCPGVAKTASCQALAKATNRRFLSFVLQHHMPEDFGGFPVVRMVEHDGKEYEMMRRIPDEKIVRAGLEPSVVLFDELTNAGHAVQAAALQLIQDGIPGCWMYAAANPVELAAAGVELALPMINRLCVLEWHPDHETWENGCRNGFVFDPPQIPILPTNWRTWTSKWGPLLAEFRSVMPEIWAAPPAETSVSKPFPTPRSWTNGGLLCAAAESVGFGKEVQHEMLVGCVGEGAAIQFLEWVKSLDLPDPEAILRHPKDLRLPSRGDLALAVLGSIVNKIREDNTPDRWELGRDVLEVAWKQRKEAAMVCEGALWAIKPAGHSPVNRPELKELEKARVEFATASA